MKKFLITVGVTFITLVAIGLSILAVSPKLEEMEIPDL